jgi:hypothetical protein
MDTKLVQIGDRILNVDHIQAIRQWDDGTVKLFMAIPGHEERVTEYEFDGDEAKKVYAWFAAKALKIA